MDFGDPVLLTASVAPATVNGSVTFLDGLTSLGSATINNGLATLTASAMAAGTHSVTVSFTGNSNFAGASSAAISLQVKMPQVSVLLKDNGSSTYGDPVTFTATVTLNDPKSGSPTPTGAIAFMDSTATELGDADKQLNAVGQAFVTVTNLKGGSHTITASYRANPFNWLQVNLPGISDTVIWVVNPAPTSVQLTVNPPSSKTGQTVTFTATVKKGTDPNAGPVASDATKTIVLNDTFNGTTTAINSSGSGVTNGQITFSTSQLGDGQHSIVASYSGDNNYAKSDSSPALAYTVAAAPLISTMSPSAGPTGMGFVINGKNFGTSQSSVSGSVTLGGAPATVLQWSDTKIVIQVPTGAATGSDDVVVTANRNSSDPKKFNVTDKFVPNCTP